MSLEIHVHVPLEHTTEKDLLDPCSFGIAACHV